MVSGLSNFIALVGFAFDSVIEIGLSVVVIWQFADITNKKREILSLRLIGMAFFILTTYLGLESVRSLLGKTRPEISVIGIIWLTGDGGIGCRISARSASTPMTTISSRGGVSMT